jgi:uncharacterized heparinase superfamily protein
LNQERRINSWNDPEIPKLWRYNLHYFEAPTPDLIRKWVEENPVGKGDGWEPYPLSLRICNWIKWSLSGNPLDEFALESLVLQTRCLEQTLEYHLLGNHLFENAKALVFAGVFFQGRLADSWLACGLRIMETQVREQVLQDGGHFERSPMYHCLILEGILDLINLRRTFPNLFPDWGKVAARMLGWLQNMTHPDGRIAFFNDAAFGIAPGLAELAEYARRLGICVEQLPLGDSGYIRLENDVAVVLFDAALVGPDYQPGHAHADTLSFELSIAGRRHLVNSGTSTYERGAERDNQRGTASHNTISIDGQDSSEVWAGFRVARRARPVEISTDGRTFAQAAHTGYLRLKDPVIHTRRLELRSDSLLVSDTIEARGKHDVHIFFHLHPEADSPIELDRQLTRVERASHWYPEFNKAAPNKTVIGRWFGQCPARFVTLLPFK